MNRITVRRPLAALTVAALLLPLGASAGVPLREKPWPADELRPNAHIADFTLKDGRGKKLSLYRYMGKHPVVILVLSTRCPYSTAYDRLIAKTSRRYAHHRVRFLGIDPDGAETAAEIERWRRKRHIHFPVLLDPGAKISTRFGAKRVPTAFVVDRHHLLFYQGSLGNSAAPTDRPEQTNLSALGPALTSLVKGGEAVNPIVHAFGCVIKP